jgi:hypothetical protein
MKTSNNRGNSRLTDSILYSVSKSAHTYAFPQAAWERQLQRELQDPNRFYDGEYDCAESFSLKGVRLG